MYVPGRKKRWHLQVNAHKRTEVIVVLAEEPDLLAVEIRLLADHRAVGSVHHHVIAGNNIRGSGGNGSNGPHWSSWYPLTEQRQRGIQVGSGSPGWFCLPPCCADRRLHKGQFRRAVLYIIRGGFAAFEIEAESFPVGLHIFIIGHIHELRQGELRYFTARSAFITDTWSEANWPPSYRRAWPGR